MCIRGGRKMRGQVRNVAFTIWTDIFIILYSSMYQNKTMNIIKYKENTRNYMNIKTQICSITPALNDVSGFEIFINRIGIKFNCGKNHGEYLL